MSRDKLSRAVEREVKLLECSSRLLSYRRLNWRMDASHRIRRAFETFVQETRWGKYPFSLHVTQHEHPVEGMVQISATKFPTGAVTRTTTHDSELRERVTDIPVLEEGGTLVASLSVSGHVAFIVHPRRSDRIKPAEEQIFLFHRLDPTDVTDGVLERVLLRYLLYMRSTSVIGIHDTLNVREYLTLLRMKVGDVRYQYRLSRALLSMQNEWGKLLLAGLIGWLVAYVTGAGK
ncbi:hypothetical protein [Polaromonas sp. JS666]|uniref:hypothetical protein n=1 Tax=Polaromonas sp. (strain JS666 / ATCC BAA-500) TaxID=296591 RepID=UPI000883BAAB|nr:hypothetical protein [Polaromonas sp. JS666]SDN72097.1 hypothetical protein SAMN05720382_10736 [Polaromonas sp. JS666]